MAELGEGLSGYLDVQDATLRAPRLEAVSNIGIANTAPRHAFSVGSNLYVSTDSSNVLTVNGNVACEGIKMGLIEITPSYDLAAVSNVGNVTQSTIQFSNATTGFVTTSNVEIGGDLVVSGNTTVSTDLTVSANAQIGRDLVVSGNTTVSTDLTVSGNTTVSTDLTVSANATVADTLTISEHLIASKEATVTGNLHVTTIRSDSNVVTEYTGPHDRPLRKYPEVAIINGTLGPTGGIVQTPGVSESQRGYTVTSSSSWGTGGTDTRAAWCVFDEGKSTTTHKIWQSGNYYTTATPGVYNRSPAQSHTANGVNYEGEWIKLELPRKINISEIEINATAYSSLTGHVAGRPYEGAILGSNDDSTWSLLKSFSGGLSWATTTVAEGGGRATLTSDTNTTNKYRYIMLVVNKVQGSRSSVDINEIKYYGHEEGSGSLDTTLKTVYNVPATTGTQLEVYYDAKGESTVQSPIPDLSPNTNTGALSTPPPTLDTTDGIESFKFNGSSQYINAGNIGVTAGSGEYPHSMSAWIKIDTLTSTMALTQIGSDPVSAGNTSIFYINTLGNIILDISGGSNTEWYSGLLTNQWYHVSYTYNGGASGKTPVSYKLYINGVDQGHQDTGAGNGTLNLVSGSTLAIGSNHLLNGNFFDGSVANFRHYSKILNADQVKELYDYQKDYFLGSKSQVTLYKGHLGVGVTEPSGQLELAGDERIQEYPPRALTGYETLVEGHGVFCASWSSNAVDASNDTWYGWRAFDGDPTTNVNLWHSNGGYSQSGTYTTTSIHSLGGYQGEWVRLDIPYEIKLTSFRIRQRSGSNDQAPKSFLIIGSNTGNEWDLVFTIGDAALVNNVSKDFTVNSTKYYKYYALVVTSLAGTGGSAAISELRYFGTPGPTTLDKGSLTLGRSLDVPRISRYDVDTETPRPEKLVVDFDTTVNSSPTDISGKGNHGTFNGDASYSPADKAFKFDGTNDYIQTRSGSNVISGTAPPFTASVWVNNNSTDSTYATVFSIEPDTYGTNTNVWFYILSGKPTLQFENNYVEFSEPGTSTGGATSNTWHHLAVTFNGSSAIGGRKCWLNGIEQVSSAVAGSAAGGTLTLGTTRLTLGVLYYANNHVNDMTGQISNFKLYSVALEASEVQKLYRLGRTGRSMVISDTAVGIGKVPEAQLDVRGNMIVRGAITNDYYACFEVNESYYNTPDYLSWKSNDNQISFNSGITLINQSEIELGVPGIYMAFIKLNSDSTQSGRSVLIYAQYYDGTTWHTEISNGQLQTDYNGGTEVMTQHMLRATTHTKWRFYIIHDFTNAPSPPNRFQVASGQWSRLMISKIA